MTRPPNKALLGTYKVGYGRPPSGDSLPQGCLRQPEWPAARYDGWTRQEAGSARSL
jgi:hypothetical protein